MKDLLEKILHAYRTGDDEQRAVIVMFCKNLQNYDYHITEAQKKADKIIPDSLDKKEHY